MENPTTSKLDDSDAGAILPNGVSGIDECCKKTIDQHAEHNPMMVCSQCQQIIKCFGDEKSYRNYLRFCESRRREVQTDCYRDSYVVVFHSYGT